MNPLNLSKEMSSEEIIKKLRESGESNETTLVKLDTVPVGYFLPLTASKEVLAVRLGKRLRDEPNFLKDIQRRFQ